MSFITFVRTFLSRAAANFKAVVLLEWICEKTMTSKQPTVVALNGVRVKHVHIACNETSKYAQKDRDVQ